MPVPAIPVAMMPEVVMHVRVVVAIIGMIGSILARRDAMGDARGQRTIPRDAR